MQDASCRREDLVAAYDDLVERLDRRRVTLWTAYLEATSSMSPREYSDNEPECWSVLRAGLSGIEAEHRVLEREFERRMAALDDTEAVA